MPPTPPSSLLEVLEEARSAGFLGPGPLDAQIRHAEGFVAVARRLFSEPADDAADKKEGPPPGPPRPPQIADLGSGGGLPGLVVAQRWPEARVVLVEAQGRRAAFLGRAVQALGLTDRVSVRQVRAEVLGRELSGRGCFDLVVARSFGVPAVVAECAAPLLRVGGWLVVSEPPDQDEAGAAARWPPEPLRQFGLEPAERARGEFEYRVLRQVDACPDRFPRRDGVPAKRPLF